MATTRAKKVPADERRNITVEAVIDLAGSTNPGDITTAAIARHMKLTQGAIFRHFPTKDAIWKAVVAWVAANLMKRIERAAAGIDSPLGRLEAMFLAHVAFVSEYPGAPRLLFGELQSPRKTPARLLAQTLMAQYAARLREVIAAAKMRGEVRADLDDEAAATLFIGSIQGLVMQALIAGDLSHMNKDAPRIFAIYRRGIAADGADKRGA
jgi:AcrR family transcriptional regulator